MFTAITRLADIFFTKFLEDREHLTKYLTLYHRRLQRSYLSTIHILAEYNIPFNRANAGMFIWIDLSSWLPKFGTEATVGREMKLTIWLLQQGVYLEPGKVSLCIK